jgi:hypothetical protein
MVGQRASFALYEVERIAAAGPRFPTVIAGTLIFGLEQLESSDSAAPSANGFVDRWRDAIRFHIGGEEFDKFCAR